MPGPAADFYAVLGLSPEASDAEVRTAYRRLARIHHPDHNGGSAESTHRFAEIQDAYARILDARRRGPVPRGSTRATTPPPRPAATAAAAPGRRPDQADLDARIAAMERELQAARAAQAKVREAARSAARAARAAAAQEASGGRRPTPEELGYITTDDSFTKIAEDARRRWSRAADKPLAERLQDLFGDGDADAD